MDNSRTQQPLSDGSGRWVSAACEGERCGICGQPAAMKVGEEILFDDPFPNRHNLTQYLCAGHGSMVLSPYHHRDAGCPFCDHTGVHPRFLIPRAEGSPQPASPRPFWLIERGQEERHVPTVWFRELPHNAWDWVEDATKATRFPDRASCAAKILAYWGPRGGYGHATEHMLLPIAAEGGDTLTPETPLETAQPDVFENAPTSDLVKGLRWIDDRYAEMSGPTSRFAAAAANRLEAQAARIAALEAALTKSPPLEAFDHTAPEVWMRMYREWKADARRALVGEEAP